jgi:hypothetical protein
LIAGIGMCNKEGLFRFAAHCFGECSPFLPEAIRIFKKCPEDLKPQENAQTFNEKSAFS